MTLWAFSFTAKAHIGFYGEPVNPPDSITSNDTIKLPYEFEDQDEFSFFPKKYDSPLFLNNPENIKSTFEYDPIADEYILKQKVGEFDFRPPAHLNSDQYWDYKFEQLVRDYWRQKARGETAEGDGGLIPQLKLGGETFNRIFGSNTINIVPQGAAELIFGVNINKVEDPKLSEKLRKTTTFDFEEKIQMNVSGTIGDKIKLGITYDTEATFDFENQTKLEYSGNEDEILQKVEAGNVSLPLPGSLISGSQSLFGLKTKMKFGNLEMTSVFSQQKGESKVIEVKGGAQTQQFEIKADEYEENRHFFLAHHFREKYNEALSQLPVIKSNINISKVEVWVTNRTSNFEDSRNVIAFMDLGESNPENIIGNDALIQPITGTYPDNEVNDLYNSLTALGGVRDISQTTNVLQQWQSQGFYSGQDYVKLENARKLNSNEFTINRRLGYISLKSPLRNDEVLAVAFEFTAGGQTFQVGDFSTDGINAPDALFLKLLKGTSFTPDYPNWRLMMKNIYSFNAYQINKEGFRLNVLYQDDKTGNEINYIPAGSLKDKLLLRVLNLDNVNSQNDASPDGRFDFIDGITIDQSNGKIIFPAVQPFGDYLRQQFKSSSIADKYVFEELYDSTLTIARQIAEKNKFKLGGEFQSSSSSEIPLNAMNIPEGSVVVTAGGRKLTENVDYTVDYNLGRVKILNEGLLESQTPIKISLESQSTYNMQMKTLVGSHFNYNISEDFNLGATVLNLTERPLTKKVMVGNEPISNTILGFNGTYRTESQFITKLVDKLPFLETKEQSSITFDGEFAHLIPGHSRAIEKEGVAYIDDFEGSETAIDMKQPAAWVLASTPQGQTDIFPEAQLNDTLLYNFNRAKLAWYHIDPLFLRESNSSMPQHLKSNPDQRSSHFVREVYEKELFPNKDNPNDVPAAIQVLNLAYFPDEKGPYNYEYKPDGEVGFSEGLNEDGSLKEPETRWGGVMREIATTDFEESNVEYIEFWLMDPFVYDTSDTNEGKLYFNLGNVSEDILKDSRKAFENGLPTTGEVDMVDTTSWGRIPLTQSMVNAFANDPEARQYQDVGLDGLGDEDEASFFGWYLDTLQNVLSTETYQQLFGNAAEEVDPSGDNYHYYRGEDYDQQQLGIIQRYKKYNGLEGNSPTDAQSPEPYPTTGKNNPDVEDINQDNTLAENENYYQYEVELDPNKMNVGQNYITDKVTRSVELANGENSSVSWYQFKIPVRNPDKTIGNIRDFQSIRFMRMFMRGFRDSVILRFAKLNLVRGEWRKYDKALNQPGESTSAPEYSNGVLNISSVNIEENASKNPVNYVLPPGIDRVVDPTNPQLRQLNEQAIVLKVEDLEDGDARAVFKNVQLDVRQYKKLKMFAHAEAVENEILDDKDLTAFIRIGTDYRDNYYEYEIPLDVTPPGNYNNDLEDDRNSVWKNQMIINLKDLPDLKLSRNKVMQQEGSNVSVNTVYSIVKGDARISVRGNPNLSDIRTIMLGIRNPNQQGNILSSDDGMIKSGEIWLNELRLTDFKEDGGWAARGRMSTQLADFGNVNLSGNMSTPGFGSIDKKVNERSKETVSQYDLSANLNLGKFFSKESGVHIPMYFGFSERFVTPQYNPLNPDILLDDALNAADDKSARDSIKYMTQDYTMRKSLNFTNIHVQPKNQGKPKIYDLSNFSLNYSYNEIFMRDINTEYDQTKEFNGGLIYTFNTRPKTIEPFKNAGGIFNSQWLKIIKDFNFNYYPSSFIFKTDFNRRYNATKFRSINNPNTKYLPTYDKNFLWDREYRLTYDLTRSIKIKFNARNRAVIDEPEGEVSRETDPKGYENWKDSVWTNIQNFGRNTQYNHQWDASYRLPINKLPLFNWINVSSNYNATYNWEAGPVLPDSSDINLGNTIRNSNTIQLNGQMNLLNLYNKVGFLKNINQKYRGGRNKQEKFKTVKYEEKGVNFEKDVPKQIHHDLQTENVTVKVFDNRGRRIKGDYSVINKKKVSFTSEITQNNATVEVEGKVEKKEGIFTLIAENFARVLMSVKNVSLSLSRTEGSELPGFLPGSRYMGMSQTGMGLAPGIPFIMGWQNENFGEFAASNSWITTDENLSSPFILSHSDNINARATIEPFKGFKINLTATRAFSKNSTEFYVADSTGTINPYGLQQQGNFSISYLTIGTAFEKLNQDNDYKSTAFENLKKYRSIISGRMAEKREPNQITGYNPDQQDGNGFHDGYGPSSQQVLIPAFLSAYGEYSPQNAPLKRFPLIPFPNWRVSISNLSKISFLKEIVKNVNISHSYRSTYAVGSYLLNPDYMEIEDGYSYVRNRQGNFIPEFEINSVSINEQFSPLINLDITWKNNITSQFQISKSRRVSLSFSNNQITETMNEQYSVQLGYRFEDFNLFFDFGNQQESMKNDLNVKGNFKIRENFTILRKLDEEIDNMITAGQKAIVIGFSADYSLTNRFNFRLFYDQNINEPKISRSYPTSNTNFGFSLRFTLAE